MWKKLIALFFGANALALGGDAVTDNIPKIEAKDIPVAEEVVKIKEVDNVVEAEFSWKDATPLKVKYDLGEPTLAEKLKDKRDIGIITETVTDFDGGFKVDILLNEKPDTNVFCYAIEGHENYDFFYQPPLTQAEIDEGASRPPEIEGSYAVYHKTLKNHILGKENYATGKVMHIPRPQVWSMLDVNKKVWADMQYNNGQLCVTVPQDFLDKAKYPVRVDPTFGYTSIGASTQAINSNNDMIGADFTSPSDAASIDSLTYYARKQTSGTASSRSVVALTSTLVIAPNGTGTTQTNSITTTAGWVTSPFASLLTVSSSTTYYLTFVFDIATVNAYYDTNASFPGFRDTSNSLSSPTNPTDRTSLQSNYSIYATYTASGGGGGGEGTVVQDIFWFD